MLPTYLILLLLNLLGVICAHGFGCYSGLGTSTILWTEVFGLCQVHFGLPARTNKIGCVALVSDAAGFEPKVL